MEPGRTWRSSGEPFEPRHQFLAVALIADGFAGGGRRGWAAIQLRVLDALRGAPLWVHLRDHGVDAEAFATAAETFVPRLRDAEHEPHISVNTHLGAAEALGVGFHVTRRGPSVEEARHRLGPTALVTASVHSVPEARAAVTAGASAVFFGPIFPTLSKPNHPGVGLAALEACCRAVPVTPVFALGGVTPDHVGPCLDAGARGVAVLSGILHADRPSAAAAHYTAQLKHR
jgi:thiamine-phosphate pyrophosphorylase